MTKYDGARTKVEVLLRGYDQALERFRVAARDREPEPAFHALFECLNWAHALDDLIAEIWRPTRAREGLRWRARLSGGEVLDGVRYVRNRVHHQWADALELEEGRRYPLQYFTWVWRDEEELPAPDQRRPDPDGRAAYASLLAGRRAEDTLLTLADVFARVESFLVPPAVRR